MLGSYEIVYAISGIDTYEDITTKIESEHVLLVKAVFEKLVVRAEHFYFQVAKVLFLRDLLRRPLNRILKKDVNFFLHLFKTQKYTIFSIKAFKRNVFECNSCPLIFT